MSPDMTSENIFFTHRIVNLWNSLPAQVVSGHWSMPHQYDFKNELDAIGLREMVHNHPVEISETGSRSIVQ